MTEKSNGDIDLSSEGIETTSVPMPQAGDPYDPRPYEDGARRNIA